MLFKLSGWVWTSLFMLSVLSTAAQKDSFRARWIPDHAKLQFAGNIGFISTGIGYQINKDKFHADLYYGYTPKSVGRLDIHALTAKATWFALKDRNFKDIQVRPFTAGLLVNYTFGKQYFGFTPDNYPYSYYSYPTAFHVGGFIGGQINKKISNKQWIKRVGLYYELGTLDIDLISYATNTKALSLSDIVNLSFGLVTTF